MPIFANAKLYGTNTTTTSSASAPSSATSSPAPIKPIAPSIAPDASHPLTIAQGTAPSVSQSVISPATAQSYDHASATYLPPMPFPTQGAPHPATDSRKWLFIGAVVLGVYFLTEGK